MTVTSLIILVVLALAVGLFIFRAIPGVGAYFDFRGKRLLARRPTSPKPLRWP
jgi:hypothetical protein